MHNFKELNIWKRAIGLSVEVYNFTSQFPDDEKFGLISQMRRAVVSIPSNIAEGSGRESEKEFARFLNISLSSAFELETQIIISEKLFPNITHGLNSETLINNLKEIQKMIYGFKNKLNIEK